MVSLEIVRPSLSGNWWGICAWKRLKNPTNPPLKIFGTEDSAGENQSHSMAMVHRRQVRIVDKGSNRARGPRGPQGARGCFGPVAPTWFWGWFCTYSDTGWWFGTFFIFLYVGNNHPNWVIFFRGIETTNQDTIGNGSGNKHILIPAYPSYDVVRGSRVGCFPCPLHQMVERENDFRQQQLDVQRQNQQLRHRSEQNSWLGCDGSRSEWSTW